MFRYGQTHTGILNRAASYHKMPTDSYYHVKCKVGSQLSLIRNNRMNYIGAVCSPHFLIR